MPRSDDLWAPVHRELDLWAEAGRSARLWLRDDDAVAPTPALDALIALAEDFEIPVLLAVIPAFADEALARRLDGARLVRPAVHGYAHANHAGAQEKKQELGPHRPRAVVLGELAAGRARLAALFRARPPPVL